MCPESSSCVVSFTEGLMDPTSTTAVVNGGVLVAEY